MLFFQKGIKSSYVPSCTNIQITAIDTTDIHRQTAILLRAFESIQMFFYVIEQVKSIGLCSKGKKIKLEKHRKL